MVIVPVLDVKDGQVVRAAGGMRHAYRPIETPLSPTSKVDDVASGLLNIHRFPVFYVADLDAIETGKGISPAVLDLLSWRDAPEIWLDAGFRDIDAVGRALDINGVCPVIGSESQSDTGLLTHFCSEMRLILSLDFRGDAFLGPSEILANPQFWPSRIIVMTLARVGAASGPDIARLKAIKDHAGRRDVIAAGGVRHADDLEKLKEIGVSAALMATSLHDGTVTAETVSSVMGDH